ncbi:MAG: molybdopterin-dependent oxidoreductase [Caldisericum exile]|uniref:molybdopterin-dependent oxidoreductase n=1 Tax=Caldisericum exile TaxID=693075 RepID=UPI003C723254
MKNKIVVIVFVIASIVSLVYLATLQQSKVHNLNEVEITEYKGEKLTPLNETPALGIKGKPSVDIKTYKLSVHGLVSNPLNLTYDDVLSKYKHYEKVVKLQCVEGWSSKLLFEGVLIDDILKDAGVKNNANTVIFHCVDGYSTSLPLDYIKNEKILLAYKVNGIILPRDYGFPFRVVAESKYGYKWAKWVVGIEVSNDPNYRGYWESRGFSNEADIEHP